MERHTQVRAQSLGWVHWKDLQTGRWMEPTPLLAKVRGAVCVSIPLGIDKPIWISEWCVRPVTQDEDLDAPSASGDDSGNNRITGDGESGEKPPTFNAS